MLGLYVIILTLGYFLKKKLAYKYMTDMAQMILMSEKNYSMKVLIRFFI